MNDYSLYILHGVSAAVMLGLCYWLNVLAPDWLRHSWKRRALNVLGAVICVCLAVTWAWAQGAVRP